MGPSVLIRESWYHIKDAWISDLGRFVRWTVVEAWKGFIAAIFIVIASLLILWMAPGFIKSVRKLVNDVLPEDTQPIYDGQRPKVNGATPA